MDATADDGLWARDECRSCTCVFPPFLPSLPLSSFLSRFVFIFFDRASLRWTWIFVFATGRSAVAPDGFHECFIRKFSGLSDDGGLSHWPDRLVPL